MAIKYLLLPEDMYRGLLSANAENDEINLDYTKKNLQNAIKKKINPSAKNILYNQELRRYLALRKESKSKPIKVELANGTKMLVSQKDENKNKNSVAAQTIDPEDDSEVSTLLDLENSDVESENSFKLPDEYVTPQNLETPRTSKPANIFQTFSDDLRVRTAYQYMQANQKDFGIKKDSIIGPGNKIVNNSSVIASLERIANRTVENAPSPPGTRFLSTRLKAHPATKRILEQKPQKGKGIKRIEKRVKVVNGSFVPKLWI